MFRDFNQKAKSLQIKILTKLEPLIEPEIWKTIPDSYNPEGHHYEIYDDDLPFFRDTKALLNMLAAIQRMTEHYSLLGDSIFKTLEMPADFLEFKHNLNIFRGTTNPAARLAEDLRNQAFKIIIPIILSHATQLLDLLTPENFEKAGDFLTEKIIQLEQYEENYKLNKTGGYVEIKEPSKSSEEAPNGLFATLAVKNDEILRQIYKEEYKTYFTRENSSVETKDNKPIKTNKIEYYAENPDPKKPLPDTIKHLIYFCNGVIALCKVLDSYASYKESGTLQSIGWMPTLYFDIRKAYTNFQAFEYKAIISEQSKPLALYIKNILEKINSLPETLARIADRFEIEECLKENTLLKFVELFTQRYNQIAYELKIHMDYARQKYTYYETRIQEREKNLGEINTQIENLELILQYKDHALSTIPDDIIDLIKHFIARYSDDICINRKNLIQYQRYLTEAPHIDRGSFSTAIKMKLEYLANCCHLTIHSEMMESLRKMSLYLKKQKNILSSKIQKGKEYLANHPYIYFDHKTLTKETKQCSILNALKQRTEQLKAEKDNLESKDAIPASDVQPLSKKTGRLKNQILAKRKEYELFEAATKELEKTSFFAPDLLLQDKNLSPSSVVLVSEIRDIQKLPDENKNESLISHLH